MQTCPRNWNDHLRKLSYHTPVVEHWNPFAKVRQNLFGADVLALKSGAPVLVVQVTTGSNHAARRTRLETGGFVDLWKASGATLEILSWSKTGPRGGRKIWTVRREPL
jgi:hypothetical protein